MKKITIIMLTYNHEKYVSQAIESILKQKTRYELEILIGDDCSSDKTAEILNSYQQKNPEKIRLIDRKQNIGARNNFLDLLSKAKGEYIALLEGDDYWEDKNKLEKMISFLEDNKEYMGGFHNINVIDSENNYKFQHIYHRSKEFSDINSLEEHYDGKVMMTLSMVFRNIFLNKQNLTKYESMIEEVKYVCDYSLKAFLLSFGKFKYFEDIFGAYRHIDNFGTSWSAQAQIVKNEDFYIIYEKNISMFGDKAKSKLSLGYVKLFIKLNLFYLRNNQFNKNLKIIKKFKYNVLLDKSLYYKVLKRIRNGKKS
ncbi:MAG: glycosyltransferase [Cetobacterium sp.]|uniref:glycosyltransferase n=1 Tax=Cetobacterium sp. TaxID=2071632 RepID=UPI003F2B1603